MCDLPGFNCACHSPSLLSAGYDIFLLGAVENKDPINGIVGIDARSAIEFLDSAGGDDAVVLRRVELLKA